MIVDFLYRECGSHPAAVHVDREAEKKYLNLEHLGILLRRLSQKLLGNL